MPGPVITLLTDFGLRDAYVGSMKGTVLGINTQARLVDITHDVPPQNTLHGAFVLGTAWRYFPSGTIHVAVVDPGVGTERKPLLLQGNGASFLAPDNGLLSFVLPPEQTRLPLFTPYQALVPETFRAFALTNDTYWRHPVSNTFHGRDIFAPVAAHLSLGVAPEELGQPVATLTRLALPVPRWEAGILVGYVLHIDRFGNLVTSIAGEAVWEGRDSMVVELAGARVKGLASSYAATGGPVALIGSHGFLEVALPGGNAAKSLGMSVGDEVMVRRV